MSKHTPSQDEAISSSAIPTEAAQPATDDNNESIETANQIEALKTQIGTLKATIEELHVRHAAAERNLLTRERKKQENAEQYAIQKFANEMLLTADALEQGLSSIDASVAEGMRQVQKLFMASLLKFGVEAISPLHQEYDYHEHEAISMAPNEEHEDNTVIQVIQTGYRLHGRLLRPARVIVAKNN